MTEWDIEVESAPGEILDAHAAITCQMAGEWESRLIADDDAFFTVVVRAVERDASVDYDPLLCGQKCGAKISDCTKNTPKNESVSAGQGDIESSGQNTLWEGRMAGRMASLRPLSLGAVSAVSTPASRSTARTSSIGASLQDRSARTARIARSAEIQHSPK